MIRDIPRARSKAFFRKLSSGFQLRPTYQLTQVPLKYTSTGVSESLQTLLIRHTSDSMFLHSGDLFQRETKGIDNEADFGQVERVDLGEFDGNYIEDEQDEEA